MPSADFFNQFGLVAFRDFLDRDFCKTVCAEISKISMKKGAFHNPHTGEKIFDEDVKKRSETVDLTFDIKDEIERRFLALTSRVEDQYEVELKGVQTLKYCRYQTGDFYQLHVDSGDHLKTRRTAKERKVSAIVFLNEESRDPEEGKYCGGNLTFYGLNDNEAFAKFGLPLVGEQGMLITFPPTLPHEVTPVTSGERFTIATWFI